MSNVGSRTLFWRLLKLSCSRFEKTNWLKSSVSLILQNVLNILKFVTFSRFIKANSDVRQKSCIIYSAIAWTQTTLWKAWTSQKSFFEEKKFISNLLCKRYTRYGLHQKNDLECSVDLKTQEMSMLDLLNWLTNANKNVVVGKKKNFSLRNRFFRPVTSNH